MTLEVEPTELRFRRPFNHEIAQTLLIRNTGDETVAFKVKTTAPRQYCVRPNSGYVTGKQEISIQVLLQAMKEDPPLDAKCRDKFLVQFIPVTSPPDSKKVSQTWSDLEKTVKGSIEERRIKVTFLTADGGVADPTVIGSSLARTPSVQSGSNTNSLSKKNIMTPFDTPLNCQRLASGEVSGMTGNRSVPTLQISGVANPSDVKLSVSNNAGNNHASAAPSYQELQEKLNQALSEVAQYKMQIENGFINTPEGLRQRRVGPNESGKGVSGLGSGENDNMLTVSPAAIPLGVPVPITALLCLISFFIAYFLF